MKQTIVIVIFLVVIIGIISGYFIFQSLNTSKTFLDYLNKVDIESTYTINEFSLYSSSGGDRESSLTRTIQSSELSDLITELKNIQPVGSFESEGRICYYTNGYLVCFNSSKLVNFVKKDGPSNYRWNVLGYDFNFKRSTIVNSISDLKNCNKDFDCTLTASGVCDPSGKCSKISAACDPGCRTSINVKYNFIWEFVPFIEDQCLTDKCASIENGEYFIASCKNNACESVIIS
jgi:hypothetical protein